MRHRAAAVVGLVVILVLAGCSGAGGSDTPTLTPAPPPDPTATPTTVPTLAPGLTPGGVADASQLTKAHFDLLQNTPYTARSVRTIREADGTIRTRRTEVFKIGSDGTISQNVEIERPGRGSSLIESWRNRTQVLFAITREGETDYIVRSAASYSRRLYGIQSTVPESQQLFVILHAVETESAEQTQNGTIRIAGRGLARPVLFDRGVQGSDVRNVSLRATVTPEGLVRSFELRYTADRAGKTVRVERRLQNRAVGTTSVDPPPWYDRAIEATGSPNETVERTGFG